jgi:hypothetical protein
MSNTRYIVHARWDDQSKSWWTDGEDIPGLCCQAPSFDELVEIILGLAPDLLSANGVKLPGRSVDITVTAERHGTAALAA